MLGHGERNARGQSAAAAGHEDDFGRNPERRSILGDLQAGRALPGYD
jgi:hypothetical protein